MNCFHLQKCNVVMPWHQISTRSPSIIGSSISVLYSIEITLCAHFIMIVYICDNLLNTSGPSFFKITMIFQMCILNFKFLIKSCLVYGNIQKLSRNMSLVMFHISNFTQGFNDISANNHLC